MKNLFRKAITGLFATGLAVALFPALTAYAAGTDLGTKTLDLSDGNAFAVNDGTYAWVTGAAEDRKILEYDEANDIFYEDYSGDGTADLIIDYEAVKDENGNITAVTGVTIKKGPNTDLETLTLTISGSDKEIFDQYDVDHYTKVKIILKKSDSTDNNNTTTNNDNNNTTNPADDNNNNNNNTPSVNNDQTSAPALYEDLCDALNYAISKGEKVTVEYKTTGDALPLYVIKKLVNNPNITLDYTFVYEGNTYNLKLNKKNIKFDETIEWYGPLYLLKYAGKNK